MWSLKTEKSAALPLGTIIPDSMQLYFFSFVVLRFFSRGSGAGDRYYRRARISLCVTLHQLTLAATSLPAQVVTTGIVGPNAGGLVKRCQKSSLQF